MKALESFSAAALLGQLATPFVARSTRSPTTRPIPATNFKLDPKYCGIE
jgi:hypothetical protein